ncbi:MAG: hypothetical protein AAFY41_14025, partial [Bacteroidota bacterium]
SILKMESMSIQITKPCFFISMCFILSMLLLTACGPSVPEWQAEHSTYVLLLADTSRNTPRWVTTYRQSVSPQVTVVVSGDPNETTEQILQRLPWLLQPGVDTLYVSEDYQEGTRICDSLTLWSPTTICVVQ